MKKAASTHLPLYVHGTNGLNEYAFSSKDCSQEPVPKLGDHEPSSVETFLYVNCTSWIFLFISDEE